MLERFGGPDRDRTDDLFHAIAFFIPLNQFIPLTRKMDRAGTAMTEDRSDSVQFSQQCRDKCFVRNRLADCQIAKDRSALSWHSWRSRSAVLVDGRGGSVNTSRRESYSDRQTNTPDSSHCAHPRKPRELRQVLGYVCSSCLSKPKDRQNSRPVVFDGEDQFLTKSATTGGHITSSSLGPSIIALH